jgi:hypothetical protein
MTGVPVLAVTGWETNRKAIMIKLFEYFITSDYGQSNTFKGKVQSLKYLVAMYTDKNELRTNIISSLTFMYNNYFKNTVVSATMVDDPATSVITYTIDIACVDADNNSYVLSQTISETGGTLLDIDTTIANIRGMRSTQ